MRETFTLGNGVEIPAVGFGTYKTVNDETGSVVAEAVRQGYRHLDTASFYHNEEAVGKAVKESGIPREEFFITTKLWRRKLGYEQTYEAFEDSLAKLGLDYLDLYLIHWPRPVEMDAEWKDADAASWKAMEELYRAGRIRAIGVSNFLPHHLNNLIERTGIMPAVNQVEFHPGYIQKAAVDFSQRLGIQVEAWMPLGRGKVLGDELIVELASKYEKSPAQICIRFALQCGVLPLPKSSSPERMRENMDVFGFDIEADDMHRLMTLPQIGWSGLHPDRADDR